MRAIQLGVIGAGSITHSLPLSLSVLLSAVEMTLRTHTALEIAQWVLAEIICTHTHVLCILATVTIQGWHLFRLELPIVCRLFNGSDYLRAASNISIKEVWYIVGASLSEPHTSVTALCTCMCMYVCLSVCLRPYTENF